MEKQSNREERLIKKLLNEVGTEKPSADFKSKIMMAVERKTAPIPPYKPLIPQAVWFMITGVVIIAIAGLSYINSDLSIDLSANINIPKFDMPELHFSKTMQYAIAFVALFFLQIPFLKKFLDSQYRL